MSNKRRQLWGYYLGIGMGIILVVAFLTSQIIMPLFFGRAKSIEVPNVLSFEASKASNLLTDKKIHAIVRDSTWSDDIARGFVISQKPEAGAFIKPDGSVYLEVSRGSRFVKVPELVGLDVQSAWIVLKNNGLRFVVADSVYSDLYAPNTVVQSAPDQGMKVEKNSKIKLYISKGHSSAFDQPQEETLPSDYNY